MGRSKSQRQMVNPMQVLWDAAVSYLSRLETGVDENIEEAEELEEVINDLHTATSLISRDYLQQGVSVMVIDTDDDQAGAFVFSTPEAAVKFRDEFVRSNWGKYCDADFPDTDLEFAADILWGEMTAKSGEEFAVYLGLQLDVTTPPDVEGQTHSDTEPKDQPR